MGQVIIYQNDKGRMSVIYPAPEWAEAVGIMAIALKDVPHGKVFKIIDAAEVPTDPAERAAWFVADSELTDGVGGESSEFQFQDAE